MTVVSVVSTGDGQTTTWTFSSAIISAAGLHAEAFQTNGEDVDNVGSPSGSSIDLEWDDGAVPGDHWAVMAPTGITFANGGDVAPTSGTVS